MPRFSVRFREVAVLRLTDFLEAYESAFVQLFDDSGIWSESIIIEQYKRSAQNIYDQIFYNILLKLSEDKNNNERIVESLSIGQKSVTL